MKFVLLVATVGCFVCAAFNVNLGSFKPRWEMLGVACFISALYLA